MNLDKSEDFLELIEVAKKNPNVIALILFDSYAKGKQKANSDIDVCIIKKDINKVEGFEGLYGYDVDLVFLNNMPEAIKFKILTEGKILFVNDVIGFKDIRRKIVRSYIDFYPAMQRQYKRLLANV